MVHILLELGAKLMGGHQITLPVAVTSPYVV